MLERFQKFVIKFAIFAILFVPVYSVLHKTIRIVKAPSAGKNGGLEFDYTVWWVNNEEQAARWNELNADSEFYSTHPNVAQYIPHPKKIVHR